MYYKPCIYSISFHSEQRRTIGVNATGDTSPAMFGQPGTKYLISPAKFVKFLLSHAKRHCIEPMNTARGFD